jgi:hypothetical protein
LRAPAHRDRTKRRIVITHFHLITMRRNGRSRWP